MINELYNPYTQTYLDLKRIINAPDFDWHRVGVTIGQPGTPKEHPDFNLFAHAFLGRPIIEHPFPKVMSKYAELAAKVVAEILLANDIYPHVIYRISVNCVVETEGISPPHVDHEIPHKNLIVYLNTFTGGRTLVLGKDGVQYASNPKEDLPICFDGELSHCHEASNEGNRLALIATFL